MTRSPNVEKLDSKSPNTIPKKKTPKKDPKGLKWFKGSSNRARTQKKLLKHAQLAQRECTPQDLPIPARIVEFDIDGTTERLGIFEVLGVIEKGFTVNLFSGGADLDDGASSSFPNSPMPIPISAGRKIGKGKGKLKPPHKRGNNSKAIHKLTKNPNNNWSISESSESSSSSTENKLPEAKFRVLEDFQSRLAQNMPNSYIRYIEKSQEELADEVEYDLDEEDCAWLELVNDKRRQNRLPAVLPESMEFLMDRLEKESYFQMQSTGMDQAPLIDDDAVCCICMDGECQNSNAILFCDMCNLAVHQECYGVPYIPEGQWLCRRCLQSPSRGVDCVLCPNKGGAFKQTDDGQWAHVICAIWIPEVCFANTVFLEPIDSINNIPPARWKLCCYICKQKGVGACIQCFKTNCYTAFHVTCAQQANLCMKMDTVRESNAVIVKKTAYCDHHAPPEPKRKEVEETSPRQKMKQTRKLLAEKRSALPVVSIPTIPTDRVFQIATNVPFVRKHQFMKRLMAYWKLKRQMRNGVPLLRRLQAASLLPSLSSDHDVPKGSNSKVITTSLSYYQYWVRLRQDLEKARLLCELIRKRERLKKSLIHAFVKERSLTLMPFNSILLNAIDEIAARDPSEIFSNPVDTKEVLDYLLVVEKPMDLSTMRDKVNSFEYSSIDEFEKDFNLMIHNCLIYNTKDTIYYKEAIRLRELGGIVIREAKRLIQSIGFDQESGMHLPQRKYELPAPSDSEILDEVERILEGEDRFDLPIDQHIEKLQELLDSTLSLSHPLTRKNRFYRVRLELIRIRKMQHQSDESCTFRHYKELLKSRPVILSDSESVSSVQVGNQYTEEEPLGRGIRSRRGSASISNPNLISKSGSGQIRSSARSLRPIKRKSLVESPLHKNDRRLSRLCSGSNDSLDLNTTSRGSRGKVRRSSVQSSAVEVDGQSESPNRSLPKVKRSKLKQTNEPKYKKAKICFGGDGHTSRLAKQLPKTKQRSVDSLLSIKGATSPLAKPPRSRTCFDGRTRHPDSPNRKTRGKAGESSMKGMDNQIQDLIVQKHEGYSTPRKLTISENNFTSPTTTILKTPTSNLKHSPPKQRKKSTSEVDVSSTKMSTPNSSLSRAKAISKSGTPTKPTNSDMTQLNKMPSVCQSMETLTPKSRKGRNTSPNKMDSSRSKNKRTPLKSSPLKLSPKKASPTNNETCLDGEPSRRTRSKTPSSTTTSPTKLDISDIEPRKKKRKNSRTSPSQAKKIKTFTTVVDSDRSPCYINSDEVTNNNNISKKPKQIRSHSCPQVRNRLKKFKSPIKTLKIKSRSTEKVCPSPKKRKSESPTSRKPKSDIQSNRDQGFLQYRKVQSIQEESDEDGRAQQNKSLTENEQENGEGQELEASTCAENNKYGNTNGIYTAGCEPSDLNKTGTSNLEALDTSLDQFEELLDLDEEPGSIFSTSYNNGASSVNSGDTCELYLSKASSVRSETPEANAETLFTFAPKPMDIVWAKHDDLWYPGLVVNPNSSSVNADSRLRVVPIPPNEMINSKPSCGDVFLVLPFDGKANWKWVELCKLEPLGIDKTVDKFHLNSCNETDQKSIRKAYERAVLHRCRDKSNADLHGKLPPIVTALS